jgi:hypothetical protein
MGLSSPLYKYNQGDGPDEVGVYELGYYSCVVYIGSGTIRRRLLAHARDEEKTWATYRCLVTNDRRRARQIERREQRRYLERNNELPTYNSQIG